VCGGILGWAEFRQCGVDFAPDSLDCRIAARSVITQWPVIVMIACACQASDGASGLKQEKGAEKEEKPTSVEDRMRLT